MTVIQVYKFDRVEWDNTSEKRVLTAWQKVISIILFTHQQMHYLLNLERFKILH
jgi:hypothetical protein